MRTKWYLLGCATSVLLLIVLFVISIVTLVNTGKKTEVKVEMNSALVINLDKVIPEYSEITDNRFNMVPVSAHDVVEKIKSAKIDPKIKCIILKPNGFSSGYASLHEMMLAIQDFKKSGKKVYAYLNMVGQKDYIFSSVADEIYLNPSASAGIVLTGVGSNLTFYKDMMDKLGVEFKIIRAGKFKAAGETFSRNSMSPEFRNNLMELFGDIYGNLCSDIAENRKISADSVHYVFEKRPNLIINQEEPVKYGMITGLMQEEELLKKINIDKDHMISVAKYEAIPPKTAVNQIAIIYAVGEITPVKAQFGQMNITAKNMKKVIDIVKKDNSIKAVVLRVNSPGGSALESDKINYYIEELKKVKPIVVSMSDVAASGGYYISANANYIYADPYTITGSIGVISMIPDVNKLGKKIGLKSESAGYGKYVSAMDVWNPINPELINSFQESVDDTYLEFKTVVSRGRKITVEEVDAIAQGKVWSANGAKNVKLIDEIGTLTDAVEKAAKLVNLTTYTTAFYPEKRNLLNAVLEEQFDIQLAAKVLTGKYSVEYIPQQIEQTIKSVKQNPLQMKMPFSFED
ncbi:MAG TPA: signal peptide peptidase SppA [Candidatus Cloacimonadota bacterium]|nr:signal peptide peptidase SppA [Candidatus Cloacimonadota bacterium]